MIMINGFLIDASLRETHTLESAVTEYPVETGSTIVDNVRPKPRNVEIEGIVSNTPLPGPVANARGTTDEDGNFDNVPSDDALAMLEAIYEKREPIEIVTELKTYENMVMTSLTIPLDAETGNALNFTATFQQIIFVTNNRATIKVAPPTQTGLGPRKDLGNRVVFNLKDASLVWHHSQGQTDDAGVYHAAGVIEHLGTSAMDQRDGKPGIYHITGAPLNSQELAEWNIDEQIWANTHDTKGNKIGRPFDGVLGANGYSNSGGSIHSTAATFDESTGMWRDSTGQPVVYSPQYGNWIEVGDYGKGDVGFPQLDLLKGK